MPRTDLAAGRTAIARATRTARLNPDDDTAAERLASAQRAYTAAKLEEHIRKVVEAAPPLTPEQRQRLALLLRPAGQ
jgi:hypothetical protein